MTLNNKRWLLNRIYCCWWSNKWIRNFHSFVRVWYSICCSKHIIIIYQTWLYFWRDLIYIFEPCCCCCCCTETIYSFFIEFQTYTYTMCVCVTKIIIFPFIIFFSIWWITFFFFASHRGYRSSLVFFVEVVHWWWWWSNRRWLVSP